MSMLNTVARAVTKPVPRMISPKSHSVVDYITTGAFLACAGFLQGVLMTCLSQLTDLKDGRAGAGRLRVEAA